MKSNLLTSARRSHNQKGAVTITNLWPTSATPTAALRPLKQQSVCVTVSASAASDTSASVTHQFNLTNAQITQGWPHMTILPQDGNEITSPWFEASQAPNFSVLGKGTVAAGGTAKVVIAKPWEPTK